MGRLRALSESLAAHKKRIGHTCRIHHTGQETHEALRSLTEKSVKLENFRYQRGHVHVHFKDVILEPGKIYAITGANGCGKSTFFALLASCSRSLAALPPGLEGLEDQLSHDIMQGLTLPSDDIVEITQQMYCPLYIEPMTWLQRHVGPSWPDSALESEVAELLGELDFAKEHPNASEYVKAGFYSMETNWYSKLSGGQRSKAELISQVFLRQKCPEVLLIDEALAPLDADSKMLVQQKLKSFCNESVLLVIHHLDSHSQCVSGGFFDDNLHFEHGEASLMGICQEQDVQNELVDQKKGRIWESHLGQNSQNVSQLFFGNAIWDQCFLLILLGLVARPGGFFHDWTWLTLRCCTDRRVASDGRVFFF